MLTFSSFQRLYLAIVQLTMRIVDMKSVTFKTERRALLADKKEKEYKECIRKYSTKNSFTAAAVKLAVLKAYKVPVDVYEGQHLEIMADKKGSAVIQALDVKMQQAKLIQQDKNT